MSTGCVINLPWTHAVTRLYTMRIPLLLSTSINSLSATRALAFIKVKRLRCTPRWFILHIWISAGSVSSWYSHSHLVPLSFCLTTSPTDTDTVDHWDCKFNTRQYQKFNSFTGDDCQTRQCSAVTIWSEGVPHVLSITAGSICVYNLMLARDQSAP